MELTNRITLADLIYSRLQSEELEIQRQFNDSKDKIGYFFVDNLVPEYLAV